jgi:hypothetical protein
MAGCSFFFFSRRFGFDFGSVPKSSPTYSTSSSFLDMLGLGNSTGSFGCDILHLNTYLARKSSTNIIFLEGT